MFRTEFAVDGKWYTNALRFQTAAEAEQEARSRFLRWFVPAAWRVVPADHPEKETYQGDADPTAFQVVRPAAASTSLPRPRQLAEIELLADRIEREVTVPTTRADAAALLMTLRARCTELELPRPTREEIDAELPAAEAICQQLLQQD